MIDTHAHIDTAAFDDDRDLVLQRAWDAGLTAMIIPAIKISDVEKLRSVAASDPRLFRGSGIHPHHVGEVVESDLAIVEAGCSEADVVAVGEIGLDYYYDFCPPDIQKWYFREQLRIAKRCNKPVIVHNRESDEDLLQIIEEEQDGSLRGVLHCFTGDGRTLDRAMALGLHVSFTGNITFKRSTLDDVVRAVPADRFMIETDSPYITPVPHRGTRNEPSYVRHVAEKIAEIRSMTYHDVIETTTATARKLFGLLAILLIVAATAQAQPVRPNEDDYETDQSYDQAFATYVADSIAYSKWIKPKKFGFGFVIGSNTVVENQTYTYPGKFIPSDTTYPYSYDTTIVGKSRSFSYNGLLAFGAQLTYSFSDRITVEGSYFFSKNNQPIDYGLDPITYHIVNLGAYYNLNPYAKVNFLLNGGLSYASSSDGTNSSSKMGINLGPAMSVNIPTPVGLFVPTFVVRFNIMFGKTENQIIARYRDKNGGPIYDPYTKEEVGIDKADVTTIYSLPHLTLTWYPKF